MTRQEDDVLLEMLHKRYGCRMTHAAIAAEYGISKTAVTLRLKRVRERDCEHDMADAIDYWNNPYYDEDT